VAYGRVHRATRWTIVAIAALAAAAPLAGAQTQPEADLDAVRIGAPVPPVEGVEVAVNATVSCEGWGEAGERTLAVFTTDSPGPEQRLRVEPRVIELEAGPDECRSGQQLNASTTLTVRPTREAHAGVGVATDIQMRLEERTDGEVVREHGPWSTPVAYVTGLWAEVEVQPIDDRIHLGWGEQRHTELRLAVEANGAVERSIEATSPEGLAVRVVTPDRGIEPGTSRKATLSLDDARSAPAGERTSNVSVRVDVRADGMSHGSAPTATATTSFTVAQEGWEETGQAAGWGLVVVAGLGFAGLVYRQRRRAKGSPAVPPGPSEQDTRVAGQAPQQRRTLVTWLTVLGLVAIVWGTAEGAWLVAAGVLAWLVAAWLAGDGRLPATIRDGLSAVDPDRAGAAAIALALAALGLLVVHEAFVALVAFLLVAGAWSSSRRDLPDWVSQAVLAVGGFAVLVPLLAQGLTLGVLGALARVPVNGPAAVGLGLGGPFLVAFAVLAARCRGWRRAAALSGFAFVLVQVPAPGLLLDQRLDLGAAIVAGEVVVLAGLLAAALPGLHALLAERD